MLSLPASRINGPTHSPDSTPAARDVKHNTRRSKVYKRTHDALR
jgi:hypothetical protein